MKPFARALAALLLVAPVTATDRRLPKKGSPDGVTIHGKEGVTIHGQEVYPEDHTLAPHGYLTIVVTVNDGEGEALVRAAGDQAAEFPGSPYYAINVAMKDADGIMTNLENDAHIKYVELDKLQQVPPNEQGSGRRLRRLAESEPYGITMVLQDQAHWEGLGPPAESVKVCVVDTGYGNGHEDVPALDTDADGFIPGSYAGEWHVDGHGHGTHCAGTIGALGGNDLGVVGVIPDSLSDEFSFFIGKGLQDDGSGSSVGVMEAVQACVNNGAKVISMSLGGGDFSASDQQQYHNYYEEDDVLIVAAAGNSGTSDLSYPASYPSIMSVAAVDSSKNRASFSQYNDQVEIAAPGVDVESTITQPVFGYAAWSGTSMATPHVAGVAGLLRAYFPGCKAGQIRHAMLVTAEDRGDVGCDDKYGHGIVRAQSAYQYLMDNQCEDVDFSPPQGGCAQFSCTVDSDCDDGDDNTGDTCTALGQCEHLCLNDAACDDGSDCTADTCADGMCSHDIIPGTAIVDLEILTDMYAEETAWNFKSDGHVLMESNGLASSTLYDIQAICTSEEMEVTFTITDSYSDGICCSYGVGYYKVMVNGDEVASAGNFGVEATDIFSVVPTPAGPTPPPVAPTPLPTAAPTTTQLPSVSPSHAPSISPTHAPPTSPTTTELPSASPSVCEVPVIIDLTTDDYVSETTWFLTDSNGIIISQNPLLETNDHTTTTICLPVEDECYKFEIFDSYGRGICCSHGEGEVTVTFDGIVILTAGAFGSSESVDFCVGGSSSCIDSTLNVAGTGGRGCAFVANNQQYCDSDVASSHCPSSCDSCDEFGCVDSTASFRFNGGTYTCDDLASLSDSEVETYCNVEAAYSTCRGTCNTCNL